MKKKNLLFIICISLFFTLTLVLSQANSAYGSTATGNAAKKITWKSKIPVISSVKTVTKSKLKITWKKISGTDSYLVYRSATKSGPYTKIKTTTKLTFTDSKLKAGTTYYYRVRAVNKIGSENVSSRYSTRKAGTTKTAGSFVSKLNAAKKTTQIVAVVASGSNAVITYHERQSDGSWKQIFSTYGYVGRNGIDKTKEGDGKTPTGSYSLGVAFGNNENPGTKISYTKVDSSHYWVDDSNSSYYNQFVSTKTTPLTWNSAEHLIDYPVDYAYAVHIKYNTKNTPWKGSSIFLHCIGTNSHSTSGCVSMPQSKLVKLLKKLNSGSKIVIGSEQSIYNY